MTDNYMNRDKLLKELEELQIRLFMASYAEYEGKRLIEENRELRKDPFYQPTDEKIKVFKKAVNKEYNRQRFKNILKGTSKHIRNPAVVLLIVILFLGSSTLSVKAIRTQLLNLLINIEKEYTTIQLGELAEEEKIFCLYEDWHNAYAPTYIPEGYLVSRMDQKRSKKSIILEDKDRNSIMFHQLNEEYSQNIDTEDSNETTKLDINGEDAIYTNKSGTKKLAWKNDQYVFILESINISDEDMIKIAESVRYFE